MIKARIRDLQPGEPVADAEAISYMLGGVKVGTLQRWASLDGWPRRYSTTSRGRRAEYSIAAAKATYQRQRLKEPTMTAQTFRKKPLEVQAVQWTGENAAALSDWTGGKFHEVDEQDRESVTETGELYVDANGRWLPIETGEWVLLDSLGFYPCKAETFAATYEPAGHVISGEVTYGHVGELSS